MAARTETDFLKSETGLVIKRKSQITSLTRRVVSSEISARKFPEIYSNLEIVKFAEPMSVGCFQVQHCKAML